jgi:hypothetical protein
MATRTYYFETMIELGGDHSAVIQALRALEGFGLTYYKYMGYGLMLVVKYVGILQFAYPVRPFTVRKRFAENGVNLNIFDTVGKPMILPHMKIWLLAKQHGVKTETICEEGVFSFGGRLADSRARGQQLSNKMYSYTFVLQRRDYTEEESKILPEIKQLVDYANALDKLQYDYV